MHDDRHRCGLRGCLLPAGHTGPCDALRAPVDADERAIAAALLAEPAHTHLDSGRGRSVNLGGCMQGTELQTLCGRWLPAWLNGPDGETNRSRWAFCHPTRAVTCPVCAELSGDGS